MATTPQTTYFGDVNVYGNTTMSGTLAVLGTPALFRSNLGVVTDRTSLIGTQATPFQYAWVNTGNTTSVNFLTNIPGPIGVGTAATGTQVTVQGNVQVSNSVSTTNVNVVTSINTGSVMNVNFVSGRGGVGIGTNVVGASALAVLGTMNAVASFQAANLILSGTLNVAAANLFTLVASNIGVGTVPVTGGATLAVQGFATVSNAVTTTNVYVTTANVGTLNTGALVNSTGFFGFGAAAASGTTAYVLGDLRSSNAIAVPTMTSNGLIASGLINVATVVVQSNVGIGGAPDQGGATLKVLGNVFLSNSFTTPNVFAGFMNVSSQSNIVTGIATSNVLVGPAADLYKGFNLSVGGNVVISNALQTVNLFATSVNTTAANILSITSPVGVGMSGYSGYYGPWAYTPLNGTLADSVGNLQNPVVTGTLTYTTTNGPGGGPTLVAAPSSYPNWTMSSFINVDDGLSVSLWVKFNAAYSATQDIFSGKTFYNQGLNFAISGSKFQLNFWTKPVPVRSIINTAITPVVGTWYNLACTINNSKTITFYVNGVSVGSAIYTNSGTTMGPSIWLNGPSGLSMGEVEYASLQIYTTGLAAGDISTLYSSGGLATIALPGFAIGIQGNLYASNTATISTANTTRSNVTQYANAFTITAASNVGVGTTPVNGGAVLAVQGNLFVSTAVTTTNVFATTSANVLTLNTANIFTTSGFLGVGTANPSGTTLYVQGNVYVSNALTTGRIAVTNSNALASNATTIYVSSNVGVGTTPAAGGAALAVQGNTFISNAVTTTNVFATTSANVLTLNTGSLFTTASGFLGIGTSVPSGTSLYLSGNVYASTALATTNVRATLINATGLANTTNFTMGTGQFLGVSTTPTGNALEVSGNSFVSNSISSTNVFSTLSNVGTLNTLSIFTRNSFLGVGTSVASGTSLYVPGNVYASNAISAQSVFTQAATVSVAGNAATVTTGTGLIGPLSPAGVWAYLPFNGTLADSVGNLTAPVGTGTLTYTTTGGPGGVGVVSMTTGSYASWTVPSNAINIDATGISVSMWFRFNATMDVNGYQALWRMGISHGNIQDFSLVFRPGSQFAAFYPVSGSTLYAYFTRSWSTALWYHATVVLDPVTKTQSIYINGSLVHTGSTTWTTAGYATTIFQIGSSGLNEYLDQPTSFADVRVYNAALTAPQIAAIYAQNEPVPSLGQTLYVTGNLYASNAVTTTNVTATSANVTGVSNVTSLTQIPTLAIGTASGVRGNVVASNSVTTTNVFAPSVNTATANTLSISAPVGVGATGVWAYLPFNGTLADAAGGGKLTGPTPTGTLTYAASGGPGGNPSLQLATGSWIDYTASSTAINVDVTGATLSFWFKADTTIQNATQGLIYFQATNTTYGLFVDLRPAISSVYFSTSGGFVTSYVATTWVVGQWYHISCVLDPINKVVLMYRNGVLGGTGMSPTWSGTAGYLKTFLRVGAWTSPPTYAVLQPTSFADVRVYNAALTAPQIAAIYAQNAAAPPTGYALQIQGNLYASNALTIGGNIAATSMNLTSTLNTGSVTTAVLIANTLGWSNTNIFISNSITTTNVYATNVNAASYTGSIGINTFDGGYALKIQGNLASSNTLWSLPDVSALTSIYYVDDITKRSPHLLPTQSNAGLIQNWISTTCNAASQPTDAWWSTSPTPVFGNVFAGAPLNGSYQGSVLLPDGRVLFVPYNAPTIGIFNPTTNEYSEIIPNGLTLNAGGAKYSGGVLLPSGNVLFGPLTSNIGTFNPLSLQFSNTSVTGIATNSQVFILNEPTGNVMISHNSGISSYDPRTGGIYLASALTQGSAATLTPTGNILQIYTSGIRYYDPYAKVATNQSIASEAYRASSLTLTVNGNVVSIPNNFNAGAGNIHVIKPPPGTTIRTPIFNTTVTGLFAGGILLPTGNIVCVPFNSSNVLMIDPIALTTSNAATVGGSGLGLYGGGTLLPDGRVVFAPFSSKNVGVFNTFTPAPVEFCLSPYFNKL